MTSFTDKNVEQGLRHPISRHNSRPSSRPATLSRISTTRSNRSRHYGGEDGYSGSVFERERVENEEHLESSEENGDDEKTKEHRIDKQKSKDIIEVNWDDGDNDPLNPRQMGLGRRWMIICLMSTTAICV
jgi:hypothetical protein